MVSDVPHVQKDRQCSVLWLTCRREESRYYSRLSDEKVSSEPPQSSGDTSVRFSHLWKLYFKNSREEKNNPTRLVSINPRSRFSTATPVPGARLMHPPTTLRHHGGKAGGLGGMGFVPCTVQRGAEALPAHTLILILSTCLSALFGMQGRVFRCFIITRRKNCHEQLKHARRKASRWCDRGLGMN